MYHNILLRLANVIENLQQAFIIFCLVIIQTLIANFYFLPLAYILGGKLYFINFIVQTFHLSKKHLLNVYF